MKLSTQNRNEEKKSKRTAREEGCKLSLNSYCPSGFARVSHSASCFQFVTRRQQQTGRGDEVSFPLQVALLCMCEVVFPHSVLESKEFILGTHPVALPDDAE